MEVIDFGNVEPMYGFCGPTPPASIWLCWDDNGRYHSPPEHDDPGWELEGPRCNECARKMQETGDNYYCGKPVLIATVRSEPAHPPTITEIPTNPGDGPAFDD